MPGETLFESTGPDTWPSEVVVVIEPATVPVKEKVPVAPSVAFLMMMPPFLTLKKVHVTVSPAATTMAVTGEPSSHVAVVSQPLTGVSATA